MKDLTDAAREAQRAYMREWRKRNPDRVREINKRYWENQAKRVREKRGETDAKKDI